MADDVLGHEHLDHGKHLHKGKHAHHHHAHTHHAPLRAHNHVGIFSLGKKEDHAHNDHGHNHPSHDAAHAHTHPHSHPSIPWKRWAIAGAAALLLGLLALEFLPAFALVVAILAVNTIIEYYKHGLGNIPVDVEVASVGAALVTAHFHIGWGLLITLAAPILANMSHGHFSEFMVVKNVSLLVTALATLLLGSQPWQLFTAVLFGLITQFVAMQVFANPSPFSNFLRRATNALGSAYIIFFIVPFLMRVF